MSKAVDAHNKKKKLKQQIELAKKFLLREESRLLDAKRDVFAAQEAVARAERAKAKLEHCESAVLKQNITLRILNQQLEEHCKKHNLEP